jgi:hypothetical protein
MMLEKKSAIFILPCLSLSLYHIYHSSQIWWLMPIILAIWEAEIGQIKAQGQSGQTVHKIPSPKKITRAKWTRGVAQAVKHLLCKHEGPWFKPQFH